MLGRKGEENVEKWQCPDGVWISLSSLEKQGRWLQRGFTHQKAQKRSAKVCKTSFRQGCFIAWVPLNTQACTHMQTHSLVHFQRCCQLGSAHNSDNLQFVLGKHWLSLFCFSSAKGNYLAFLFFPLISSCQSDKAGTWNFY